MNNIAILGPDTELVLVNTYNWICNNIYMQNVTYILEGLEFGPY